MSDPETSCNVFVSRALTAIIALCAGKRLLSIKEECVALQEKIKHPETSKSLTMAEYFLPLKSACESGEARLAHAAVDCLHKMMQYSSMRAQEAAELETSSQASEKTPSFAGRASDADEAASVSSAPPDASDSDMSKEPSTATPVSKEKLRSKTKTDPVVYEDLIKCICNCLKYANEEINLQIIKALLTAVTVCEVHGTSLLYAVRTVYNLSINSRETMNQSMARSSLTHMINFIINRMEQSGLSMRQLHGSTLSPTASEILDTSVRSGSSFSPPDSPQGGRPFAPGSFSSEPSWSPSLPSGSPMDPQAMFSQPQGSLASASMSSARVHITDAMALFNFLCSCSTIQVGEEAMPDSKEMRTCIFSLDLLHKILINSGPVFRGTPEFINGIREALWQSMHHNCVSNHNSIFKLALNIFVTLLCNFKHHLKKPIGVLFTAVYLKILDNANSQYFQKHMLLQSVVKICSSSQLILDIFLNYDCDKNTSSVFECMVNSLSYLVQGTHEEENWITPQQAQNLKLLGLQALVQILRSMTLWMNKFNRDANGSFLDTEDPLAEDIRSLIVPPPATPHSTDGMPVSEYLEKQRAEKLLIEEGVKMFNAKPKHGIKWLVERDLIDGSATSVGYFLRFTDGIDKKMVGDYLGDEAPFNGEALRSYLTTFDFADMDIDTALRIFLQIFHLPGEGQKIERILERFSTRFTELNRDLFSNPDTAYILGVAIVMLNTDLHNPQVKSKMTLDQFLSQLRGINGGQDLPRTYLEGVYSRIQTNPFSLSGMNAKIQEELAEAAAAGGGFFASKRDRKVAMFAADCSKMLRETHQLINSGVELSGSPYFSANNVDHVKPMFSVVWYGMLAAFSIQLETSDMPKMIKLCLDGFEYGIHISALFEMNTEREAFVRSLAKMTYIRDIKAVGQKNIESLKSLIRCANAEGNFLSSSWGEVMRTISQLERLHIIAKSGKTDNITPNAGRISPTSRGGARGSSTADSASVGWGSMGFDSVAAENREMRVAVDEANAAAIAAQVDQMAIQKIFTNSVRLTTEGLVDFVSNLCVVAREEVHSSEPRMYSLQKVVEVATDNMGNRIVVIWINISSLLIEIGRNRNPLIAQYGVDSLRQLVMKCLGCPELLQCQLQPEFLEPFVRIMAGALDDDICDLVIRCMQQIVAAKGTILGGGWEHFFRVFVLATTKSTSANGGRDILCLAFDVIRKVLQTSFAAIQSHLVPAARCLAAFASNPSCEDISIEALEAMLAFSDHLAELQRGSASPPSSPTSNSLDRSNGNHEPSSPTVQIADLSANGVDGTTPAVDAWKVILVHLARLGSDVRVDVRTNAVAVLGSIILRHGTLFSSDLWSYLMGSVLLGILLEPGAPQVTLHEQAQAQAQEKLHPGSSVADTVASTVGERARVSPEEWFSTTCSKVVNMLVDVHGKFYVLLPGYLEAVLRTVARLCIKNDDARVIKSGFEAMLSCLCKVGGQLTSKEWLEVVMPILSSTFRLSVVRPCMLRQFHSCTPEEEATYPSAPPDVSAMMRAHGIAPEGILDDGSSAKNNTGLLEDEPDDTQLFDEALLISTLKVRLVRQQLLVEMMEKLVFMFCNKLSLGSILTILSCLLRCFSSGAFLNRPSLLPFRTKLLQSGLTQLLKSILDRETASQSLYFKILFYMYNCSETQQFAVIAEDLLMYQCAAIVNHFLEVEAAEEALEGGSASATTDDGRVVTGVVAITSNGQGLPRPYLESVTLAPILVRVINGLCNFPDNKFGQCVVSFYPYFVQLIPTYSRDVRLELKKFFEQVRVVQGKS